MNFLLDILFPKKCVGCRKEGSYFCSSCISSVLQAELVCPKCEKSAIGGQTHPICRRRFGLDGLWSLGIYENPLREAIKQLKYRRVTGLAETLVDIMVEYWAKYQPFVLDQIKRDQGKSWNVVSVPLYWWRENSRGFNQSSLIGQSLSKKLGLSYCEGLRRIRSTKSQVKLKETDRHKNIRGAFSINSSLRGGRKSSGLSSRRGNLDNILLIDDVWTTGSTLRECCYILKRAGAKKVWAVTLAR